MCLGIPMRVVECDGYIAVCEARGIARTVSLFLLQHENVVPGDNVMVHVGYAIQKMSEDESASAWLLYDEILTAGDKISSDA
jgi:hydrogenase expression/formation protein HypC